MAGTATELPRSGVRQRKKRVPRNIPNIMRQKVYIPWMYLVPALIVMIFFIVYPMVNTIMLSVQDRTGDQPANVACIQGRPCWGIFENYRYALTNELNTSSVGAFLSSFWTSSYGNNLKWMILMTAGTVIIGLAFAVLSDRVRYEPLAKALIFMPMAISFVGAGIIWGFVYDYAPGRNQLGILNGIVTALGFEPISWLTIPNLNTIALIVVGVWIWTGFAMTVLSASLKSVPGEIIEAARVDGASEWKVFASIMIPIIMPTITVVITTMVINVLKLFDLVYVMTGGNYGTDVIANRMYTEMYKNYNTGRGTAIAVVLILIILPFIYYNIRRFLEQEAMR